MKKRRKWAHVVCSSSRISLTSASATDMIAWLCFRLRWLLKSTGSRRLLKRLVAVIVFTSLVVFLLLAYKTANYAKPLLARGIPPAVHYVCQRRFNNVSFDEPPFPQLGSNSRRSTKDMTEPRVLVLVETHFSALAKELSSVLDSLRFGYTMEVIGKSLPLLTTNARGNFAIIVFENAYKYINMDAWNRQLIDKYCRDYNVGVVLFMQSRQGTTYRRAKVRNFPLLISDNLAVRDLRLSLNSSLYYITRASQNPIESANSGTESANDASLDWVVFHPDHESYESVLTAGATLGARQNSLQGLKNSTMDSLGTGSVVLLDHGVVDGIKRIFFGYDFKLWLCRLLFIDALAMLSERRLVLPFARFMQIDIDDIFVGETGYRLLPSDVDALLAGQRRLRERIPGFTFNLGFSGKFYHRGNEMEQMGDDKLLAHASEFWWFPHMWRHNKVHRLNESVLEEYMTLNKQFAKELNIPVRWPYAVAPHHSGVYPVHAPLYDTWKRVWGIQVTSTEEYPHFKPASQRRGFIHKGIMVLPRQTCGLYTHTVFADRYPGGGKARLDQMIMGGDLFFTVIYNPYLVFMTHQSNYANDRLALYTFETLVRFVQCWTNLRLKSTTPPQLADKYFRRYPEEKEAVWGNPCADKRHINIWSPDKSCDRLPQLLIVGPQKTGTTALHAFLKLHPNMVSSLPNEKTFEELQFFSGRNYRNGIDWYMNSFPFLEGSNSTDKFYFEKSATYFDHDLVPKRVKALLPKAKLIAILLSPVRRAYSWYQHMVAHNDPTATSYTFFEVLSASDDSPKQLWNLRDRCLAPGMYAQHLERWLEQFPAKQLLIVDGGMLVKDPALVMQQAQEFIGLTPVLDYTAILKYDPKKGFFCHSTRGEHGERLKCLGQSKGRQYPQIDEMSMRYLLRYYRPHNIALQKLLTRLSIAMPNWLHSDLQVVFE